MQIPRPSEQYCTNRNFVVDTEDLPWAPFPGTEGGGAFKLLRVNRDISGMTMLLRLAPESVGPWHKHCGSTEYYILDGHVPWGGDTVLPAGTYFYEAAGLQHSEPPPGNEVTMLVISYGPIQGFFPDGKPGPVIDAEMMIKHWTRALEAAGWEPAAAAAAV